VGIAQLVLEGLDQAIGEESGPIFVAFAAADHDLMLVKVDILDPQADGFHEAQAAAIEEFSHELVDTGEVADDFGGFLFGEDGGQTAGFFGADGVNGVVEFQAQHVTVEEKEGAEGLVLGFVVSSAERWRRRYFRAGPDG